MDDPRNLKFCKYSIIAITVFIVTSFLLPLIMDVGNDGQYWIRAWMFILGAYIPTMLHFIIYRKRPEEETED